jgi:hypothetical protein
MPSGLVNNVLDAATLLRLSLSVITACTAAVF